ncbi:MAG: YjjW family glycine radical enzyme activase [Candidatus Faecivicinus sp.]
MNKIIPFSAVDGPGNRTAIFVQGCSFNCRYCHNPETIRACVHCGACLEVCPTGALYAKDGKVCYEIAKCALCDACIKLCPHLSSPRIRMMTAEEVMGEVRRNEPFVRGITVSGGECTQQRDFLVELAVLARADGLNVLLDSNGSYDFSSDPVLTEAIDGVMLDVKAWDADEHVRLTDCDNQCVRKNLRFLAQIGKLEEVRTVSVPDMMDARETVRNVCRLLRECGAEEVRYKLIRFRPMGVREEFRSLRSPTDEEMRELEAIAHEMGILNTVLI